jgi:ER-bound oxygenase mpaB/B'/Rubber oxygenase, catalytic domain
MVALDDAFLDRCRAEGDPEGDALVQAAFDAIGAAAADGAPPERRFLRALIESGALPAAWSPAPIRAFLNAPLPGRPLRADVVRRGEAVFAEHGPEILMALGCYSLPAAYAANDGVRVLAKTGFLESAPTRRLVETAQMIVDVMRPGGLDPRGPGVRNARKVRLMHAAIRRLILAAGDWDATRLGVPINQEDLAGTLCTFAWLPLDALRRLGAHVRREDRDAYVQTWGQVGRILGIREELIPADAHAAEALTARIQARQVQPELPNPDGRELTRALLAMMDAHIPVRALRFGPASLMRLFLPPRVADALGIPRQLYADSLVRCGAWLAGAVDGLLSATRLERRFFRRFNVLLIEAVLAAERGGKRAEFDLPLSLRGRWQER